MYFGEPSVEIVKIDQTDIVTATSCNLETTSKHGSGEDCINCDGFSNNCGKPNMPTFMIDYPVDDE